MRTLHIGSPEGCTTVENVPGASPRIIQEVADLLMKAVELPDEATPEEHPPVQ